MSLRKGLCHKPVGCEKRRKRRVFRQRPALRFPALGRVAPGRCRPGAPTDPYVLALEHTVLRPTGSPSSTVPEAIRSSYVDMRVNLDVFCMFPSIGSVSRRFASLDRVLRGEFPCFNGSIKALRLPVVHPAALCFHCLAVPRLHSLLFAPRRASAPPRPGVRNPVAPAGIVPRRREDLPSSWGISLVRLRMFSRRRQDR